MINTDLFNQATNLSAGSIKAYSDKAGILNRKLRENNIKIKQHKRVLNFILREWTNPNTLNVYLSMMIKYLDLTGKTGIKIYKEYKDLVIIKSKQGENLIIKKTKTKNKILKKIDYGNDIKKFITDIEKIMTDKKKIKESLFLLSLYLLQPPRRNDFLNMTYTENIEDIETDKNYLLLQDGDYIFVYNIFKSAKKFGTQNFKIENELLTRIIKYQKFKVGDKIYNKTVNTSYLHLKKESKKYFGVEMSLNDLRKLHTIQLFGEGLNEKLLKDAEAMGHSVATKLKFYIP